MRLRFGDYPETLRGVEFKAHDTMTLGQSAPLAYQSITAHAIAIVRTVTRLSG